MKRHLLGLATLASVAFALPAQAQMPVKFSIAAGASLPQGDFGKFFSSGFHGTGSLGFSLPAVPLSLRVDGSYSTFSGKNSGPKFNLLSGAANVVWTAPGIGMKPYLLASLGMYDGKVDVAGASSSTKLGYGGGAGLKFDLAGVGAFAEIKYISVQTSGSSTNFIPISVGVTF